MALKHKWPLPNPRERVQFHWVVSDCSPLEEGCPDDCQSLIGEGILRRITSSPWQNAITGNPTSSVSTHLRGRATRLFNLCDDANQFRFCQPIMMTILPFAEIGSCSWMLIWKVNSDGCWPLMARCSEERRRQKVRDRRWISPHAIAVSDSGMPANTAIKMLNARDGQQKHQLLLLLMIVSFSDFNEVS